MLLPPNAHATAVLLLTALALVLFTREKIPLESSSLFILMCITVGFELFPFHTNTGVIHAVDFFSGFGHEALVAVCALMIAGQGIVRTGALEPAGRALARLWRVSPKISLLMILMVGAAISAFINNVPVVVLLLPILVNVSLRSGTPAASVLMPMGFATLLGGKRHNHRHLHQFAGGVGGCRHGPAATGDVRFPVAGVDRRRFRYRLPVVAGAPRLVPKREQPLADASPRVFAAHLAVTDQSTAVGKTLAEAREMTDGTMRVISVERGPGAFMLPLPSVMLQPGDHLVLRDTPQRLKEFETILGATLYPEAAIQTPVDEDHPLEAENQQLAEGVVVEGSRLQGRTLSHLYFGDRYGVIILALHRAGRQLEKHHDDIGDIRLMAGDVLLIQGPSQQIAALKRGEDLLVLDATLDLPHSKKAPLALAIMAGVIVAAALGLLPIAISASCGALVMILTGCLQWRDATNALSAQVVFIVVASLALGEAMLRTGGADYLARLFVSGVGDLSPAIVLSGLMLLMGVLTNIVSNNAAAVIGTPIAVSIAAQMGQPAEPFVLAVLFGANMSYATPMAYKTNLLVMNAGKYVFTDFLRIGVPLLLIMWAVLSWVLPRIYGLG